MNDLAAWPALNHGFEVPVRYHHRPAAGPDAGTMLCLHGYQDHAASMIRRLGWDRGADLAFGVLAVNAPFPVPIWTDSGFTEAYAWYFQDATRGIAVGSPDAAATAIEAILRRENLLERPLVICGFSQGGFLAPAVAARVPTARAIACVGGGYPRELYRSLRKLTVFGVHGSADDRVPIAPARAGHRALIDDGFKGEFVAIEGLGHRLTPVVAEHVTRLTKSFL